MYARCKRGRGVCITSGCATGSWWSRRGASTAVLTATGAIATTSGTAAARVTSEYCCRVSVERARGVPRGVDRWKGRERRPRPQRPPKQPASVYRHAFHIHNIQPGPNILHTLSNKCGSTQIFSQTVAILQQQLVSHEKKIIEPLKHYSKFNNVLIK